MRCNIGELVSHYGNIYCSECRWWWFDSSVNVKCGRKWSHPLCSHQLLSGNTLLGVLTQLERPPRNRYVCVFSEGWALLSTFCPSVEACSQKPPTEVKSGNHPSKVFKCHIIVPVLERHGVWFFFPLWSNMMKSICNFAWKRNAHKNSCSPHM